MSAREVRDREAHTFLGGGGTHHETRRRRVGFDCLHPPTQAEAILDLGQASVSLPACACILS